jgi:hypothetical protein
MMKVFTLMRYLILVCLSLFTATSWGKCAGPVQTHANEGTSLYYQSGSLVAWCVRSLLVWLHLDCGIETPVKSGFLQVRFSSQRNGRG